MRTAAPITTYELIKKKMLYDEKVQLNEQQAEIFQRWEMAAELRMLENLPTKRLVEKLVETFLVDRRTAFYDIQNVESILGFNQTVAKNFRISARINYLEEMIQSRIDDLDYETAASLERTLAKYYEMLPNLEKPEPRKPLVFVYNGDAKQIMEGLPEVEDAEAIILNSQNHGAK